MREWRKSHGQDGPDSKDDIKKLTLLLASSFKPIEICTLKCLGIFEDPSNKRYRIIYETPTYIENFSTPNTQDSDPPMARWCKPTILRELIDESVGPKRSASILDLGIRFRVAKQLAQSILVLQAAGWVHKE